MKKQRITNKKLKLQNVNNFTARGDSKAITLIALVITIVVLIILAGVTISLTIGENGIFNRAKLAKEQYLNAEAAEQEQINDLSSQLSSEDFFGGNESNSDIDNIAPIATITIVETGYVGESIEAQVEHADNSEQINLEKCKWIFTTTQEKIGLDESLYTEGPFTENPQTITVSGTQEATYYLHVLTTDNAGNKQETISTGVILQTLTFTSQAFSYKGSVETYTVPTTGVYKLEVWGAQGGNCASNSAVGGNGGYSIGYKKLTKGQVIYICVGGAGTTTVGGYNGGASTDYGGGGGGCTHMATITGTLQNIGSGNKSKVLLVAGGGGGAGGDSITKTAGGTGGGLTGGDGAGPDSNIGEGGTQTHAGSAFRMGGDNAGGFGFGAGWHSPTGEKCTLGGGGGGLYGGGGGYWTGGGGGSGYIGGVPSFDYKGTTYAPSTSNGARSGNGQAKITFVTF